MWSTSSTCASLFSFQTLNIYSLQSLHPPEDRQTCCPQSPNNSTPNRAYRPPETTSTHLTWPHSSCICILLRHLCDQLCRVAAGTLPSGPQRNKWNSLPCSSIIRRRNQSLVSSGACTWTPIDLGGRTPGVVKSCHIRFNPLWFANPHVLSTHYHQHHSHISYTISTSATFLRRTEPVVNLGAGDSGQRSSSLNAEPNRHLIINCVMCETLQLSPLSN